jgi:hypothetical protein
MRTLRLDRDFDAVFLHDAVDYMTTEDDLRAAIATAFAHTGPGGIAVFVPDDTKETFAPSTDHGGSDAPDGRGVRYLEWSWDPDPDDTWTVTHYSFLLREPGGAVQVEHDSHRIGLFPREDWLRFLGDAGFDPAAVPEETIDDRTPREIFVGRRPA